MNRVLLSNEHGSLVVLDLGNGVATYEEIALWYEYYYDIPCDSLKITQLTHGFIHMNYEQLEQIVKAKHEGRISRDKGYMEITPNYDWPDYHVDDEAQPGH